MPYRRTWKPHPQASVPDELIGFLDGDPLLLQILTQRGIVTAQAARSFLDPEAYIPTPALALPGMGRSVERILQAIEAGERICVWGDFDVDGQTATSLLVSALKKLGAQVRHYIPIRSEESHGISLPSLQKQLDRGLDLLLTCDTGISAYAAVEAAAALGIETIITDHHQLPGILPPAFSIVNPRLLNDPTHPLAALPGVGVAYKLVEELYTRLGRSAQLCEFLDLVALGIVADVASLTGENRYLLQLGLREMRQGKRKGLAALMEAADVKHESINEETIGFMIAPRLNAVGRLADANPLVEFFTTDDLGTARLQAQLIESLNIERKLLTDQVLKMALAQVQEQPRLLDTQALVLNHPRWPAGVIGIIASRLVEIYHKPVVLISSPDNKIARGSARSLPGIDITQAIAAQGHLLEGYGGHPMAAGISILPDQITAFRQGLSEAIAQQVPEEREWLLEFNALLSFNNLNLDFVKRLEQLAPFGAGNPAPIFVAQGLSVESHQVIGKNQEHLLLKVKDSEGHLQEVVWWQAAELPIPDEPFDLAYITHSSDFKGQPTTQVIWIESRPAEGAVKALTGNLAAKLSIDYRHEPAPYATLQKLLEIPDLQIWREGPPDPASSLVDPAFGTDRDHLKPAQSLIIWSIPPGRAELIAALELVQPQTIYFFAIHPGLEQMEPFLKQLAGMVKFSLRHPGMPVRISSLAAALAHRTSTTRLGLGWLQARGAIQSEWLDEHSIAIRPGKNVPDPSLHLIEEQVRQSLRETAAYRSAFLRQEVDLLLR